jgi:hypothetical protein
MKSKSGLILNIKYTERVSMHSLYIYIYIYIYIYRESVHAIFV